ncbi:glutathione transferase GstA [Hyphomicrobiales bacterium 4NK60-0047b]
MTYKLYYSPGACSMGVHAVLNELNLPVELIKAADTPNFETLSPPKTVPVLDDNGLIIREGAAIILHILEKHNSEMLPQTGEARTKVIEWLMIANATVHVAYSKLFYIANNVEDEELKLSLFNKQAKVIEGLWQSIDKHLENSDYVTGSKPTAADFMLTTYANWGSFFPMEIQLGDNVKNLITNISSRPSFQKALQTEEVDYKATA